MRAHASSRFVVPEAGASTPWLLPVPQRKQVLALLQPKARLNISDVASQVAEARQHRQAAVQRACRTFAACHALSSQHAALVLACLSYSKEAQVDAVIALWGRVVDKPNLAPKLVQLGDAALQALQSRLGCFNLARHLHSPFGARFRFDIASNADHAAAARQLCQNAAALQAVWGEAHLDVKLERQALEHAAKAYAETLRRRQTHDVAAPPETMAELLATQEALRRHRAKLRPDIFAQPASAGAGGVLALTSASMAQPELKRHFARYFRALWELQEPPAVVLQRIHIDGAPLVGRANVELQHLWADIGERAATLELEFVP